MTPVSISSEAEEERPDPFGILPVDIDVHTNIHGVTGFLQRNEELLFG